MDAYQLLVVMHRLKNDRLRATAMLDTILIYDPLSHFARFEKYLAGNVRIEEFTGMVRNEMPAQTFLELAIWYYNIGRNDEAKKVLKLSPPNAEVNYWLAFLEKRVPDALDLSLLTAFPFRPETADILQQLITQNDQWLISC